MTNLTRNPFRFLLICLAAGAILGLIDSWISRPLASRPPTPERVWKYMSSRAPAYGLDPGFVYAIAMAESSLNATATTGYANGMMQLSRPAWAEVSNSSYRLAWNWYSNVTVAMEYLEFCKAFLEQNGKFSYPLLAACYRYGPYKVKAEGFDLAKLPSPNNKIYQQLFAGNQNPVKTP
ncbi:MAG: transglycosylase SLT domain-containing protein [Verrucomicrobiota bacterium JB024]|nr:transglycosylase SLT domain-containing protein [Verrucomicrobiota bacterium JB024]